MDFMSDVKGDRGPGSGLRRPSAKNWMLGLAMIGAVACRAPQGTYTWVDAYRDPRQGSPYTISVGDAVHVRVFGQEGMSGTARVRPDGMISLPFVSDIEAAGQSPVALAKKIQARLKDVLVNPVVTVSIDEVRPLEV